MHQREGEFFFKRFVTGDEMWAHLSTPKTKRQSIKWKRGHKSTAKKAKVTHSAGKVLETSFGTVNTCYSCTICLPKPKWTQWYNVIFWGTSKLLSKGNVLDFCLAKSSCCTTAWPHIAWWTQKEFEKWLEKMGTCEKITEEQCKQIFWKPMNCVLITWKKKTKKIGNLFIGSLL